MTALSIRNTSNDVAIMEQRMVELQTENESLKTSLAMAEADNARLSSELAVMTDKAEKNLVRSVQMETIMNQVSAGLVDGLRSMRDADPAEVLKVHTEQVLREAAAREKPAIVEKPATDAATEQPAPQPEPTPEAAVG